MKKCIDLATTHAKFCESVMREEDLEESNSNEEVKGTETKIWYPIKLLLSQTKSRLIFFKTERERSRGMTAILKE